VSGVPLRLGTRGSRLSLRQAEIVAAALRRVAPAVRLEIVTVQTAGDRHPDVPLERLEGIGFFAKEIEAALLDGRCDLAVHSAKDLPTAIHPDLCLAACLPRDDPRDVLVARDGLRLATLPPGARVATSSLRRSAQIRHYRPDLETVPVRGNIDTRLAKLERGAFDALCLAAAGLVRMGWEDRVTEWLPVEIVLPAPAQGVVAVEARLSDRDLVELLRRLDDAATREAVAAERAFVARLGTGCRAPAAALATVDGGRVALDGLVAREDGSAVMRHRATGPVGAAAWLGMSVADYLLAHGRHILGALPSREDPGGPRPAPAARTGRGGPLAGRRVVVTRARAQARVLRRLLEAEGAEVIEFPTIRLAPPVDLEPVDRAVARLGEYDWIVFTSANGVAALAERLRTLGRGPDALRVARLAAIGPGTARALDALGLRVDLAPAEFRAEALVEAFARLWSSAPPGPGAEAAPPAGSAPRPAARVLIPRAADARSVLPDGLRRLGASVDVVPVYRTDPERDQSPEARGLLEAGRVDAVTFTSSSTVRYFAALLGPQGLRALRGVLVACIGPVTAATAREHGLEVGLVAEAYTMPGLVAALRSAFESTAVAGRGRARPDGR
jgi:hydroxymethylbilane synthase